MWSHRPKPSRPGKATRNPDDIPRMANEQHTVPTNALSQTTTSHRNFERCRRKAPRKPRSGRTCPHRPAKTTTGIVEKSLCRKLHVHDANPGPEQSRHVGRHPDLARPTVAQWHRRPVMYDLAPAKSRARARICRPEHPTGPRRRKPTTPTQRQNNEAHT